MLRIGKVGANETMAKMKGKTPVATTKVSGTAKPKLWLPEFTGDQMKCFGWPKQWKSYDLDESISDTEKARLLLQCITAKTKKHQAVQIHLISCTAETVKYFLLESIVFNVFLS
jgi:hypothetical protein